MDAGRTILFWNAGRSLGLGLTLAVGLAGCADEGRQPQKLLFEPPLGQAGSVGAGGGGGVAQLPSGRLPPPSVPRLQECGQLLPTPADVLSADFALDGAALVMAYADGSVELQRVGDAHGTLLRPAGDVQPTYVSPDGKSLAWRAGDDLVTQSLSDPAARSVLTIGHRADCGSAGSITPDGQHLLLIGMPAVCLFNLADGALITQLPAAWHVGFHDTSLVVGGKAHVTTYDLTGAVTAQRDFIDNQDQVGLSPRGDTVVCRDYQAGTTTLFDVASGNARATLQPVSGGPALFSRDGALVAVEASVLRTADGSQFRPLQPQALHSGGVALSLDGTRTLSLVGEPKERRAALVDVATGGGVQLFGGTPRLVYDISVSPDGQRLVTSSGHDATGYEIAKNFAESRGIWSIDTGNDFASEYSRDGSLVAISGDGRATVDALTGLRDLFPAPGPDVRRGCFNAYFGFSSDHRWVAGGDGGYEVTVYDTATQALLTSLPSADCNTSAAFSPDDSLLATSAGELYRTSDFSRIWPNEVTPTQPQYDEALTGVEFTADGRAFVTSICGAEPQFGAGPFLCNNAAHTIAGTTVSTSDAGRTIGRPAFSRDGRWVLDEQTELGLNMTAAAFAPNGDVIAGDKAGVIHRFCNAAAR